MPACPQLLDVEEAAQRLALAPRTLRRWALAGRVPHVRLGRLVRFEELALARWISTQVVTPTVAARGGRRLAAWRL